MDSPRVQAGIAGYIWASPSKNLSGHMQAAKGPDQPAHPDKVHRQMEGHTDGDTNIKQVTKLCSPQEGSTKMDLVKFSDKFSIKLRSPNIKG